MEYDGDGEGPTHILFRVLGGPLQRSGLAILAAAKIDFGGAANPLVGALPEELVFSLEEQPQMRGLADILVAEVENSRCGGGTVQDHIREIIVVLAVRRAIDQATVNAGLLAGLAHPTLYPCLVAVHDDPARQWRTDVLARLAARENAAALPNPTRAAAVFTLLPASRRLAPMPGAMRSDMPSASYPPHS
ncbi:cupin domain-containing protein [Ensifer sesbaniae]|uniref:cupin domain-containing protein n=1 Tax=Ensifer sesbaniae TaxID=1214071 RepID=UPI00156A220E|nr:cupin domain-containing protein [Ensifer sesbaniae]